MIDPGYKLIIRVPSIFIRHYEISYRQHRGRRLALEYIYESPTDSAELGL